MLRKKMAIVVAVPMLLSAAALAQTTPDQPPASGPVAEMGMHDPAMRAEWRKEMCTDRYAVLAGRLAFLEAKLALTETQRPAWNTWHQARMEDASKARDACLADMPQPGTHPTLLDREARLEKALGARLDGLRARRPALEALYGELSPDQKAIFDRIGHPRHHGMAMRMWHRDGGTDRMDGPPPAMPGAGG